MEDIKILEDILEPFREQNKKSKKLILNITGIKYKHYEALENIINRNKTLEEDVKHSKIFINEEEDYITELNNKNCELELKMQYDYIPKSKVEEKIKYIGKLYAEDEIDCEWYSEIKQLLQELLEE